MGSSWRPLIVLLLLSVAFQQAAAFNIAINCGGKTSATGPLYGPGPVYNPDNAFASLAQGLAVTFSEDKYYYGTDMSVGYTPNITLQNGDPRSAPIYYTERSGADMHYFIPVPNFSTVTVELSFMETKWNASQQRIFDVNINGAPAFPYLDIFQWSGGQFRILPVQKDVNVTNGYILIDFVPRQGDVPKVNAIRIFSTPTATLPFDNSTVPAPPDTVGLNCGSAQNLTTGNGTFFVDTNFVGGRNVFINNSFVSGVYSTQRAGDKFGYTFALPNGDYVVELYFADGFTSKGMRVFNVLFNSIVTIPALDVVAVSGGQYVPLVLKRSATVTNGILRLDFQGLGVTYQWPVLSDAFVNAIKVYPSTTNSTIVAIAAGATTQVLTGEGLIFSPDQYFTGGIANDNSTGPDGKPVAIQPLLSGLTSALYTKSRIGASTYTIPIPNGNYVVDLRFAEPVYNVSGARVFNVTIQGVQAISLLDVLVKSHGLLNALSVQRSTVVSTGTLKISLVKVIGDPIISAILVRPDLASPQPRIYEAPYAYPVPAYPISPTAPYPLNGVHINFNPAPVLPGKFSHAVNTGCNNCPPYQSTFGPVFVADNVTCLNGGGGGGDVPPGEPYCHINILGPQGGYAVPLNDTLNITGTADPYIYKWERVGFNTFIFNVPNGIYEVNTFYAETSAEDPKVNVQGDDLRKFLQEPQGKSYPEGFGPIDPFRLANNQKFNATPPVTMYVWVGNNKLSVQLWPVGTRDAPAIKGIWAHELPDIIPLNSTDPDNPPTGNVKAATPVALQLPNTAPGATNSSIAIVPGTTGSGTSAPLVASAVQTTPGTATTAGNTTAVSSATNVCVALWTFFVVLMAFLV